MTKIINHGIPPRIVRDQQAYQLVAVIEGADANTQFINNLQVIGQQRRLLAELTQKLAATPEAERAPVQQQLTELDARLTQNLQFMTKTYGYSVQSNYLLSPVQSVLLQKAVEADGKVSEDATKATLVAELQTPEAYDSLQQLRQKAGVFGQDASKASDFEKVKVELKETFGFEVTGHYFLQVRKGALYATA
ncbi:MAG: hypothetical protein RL376_939 [Verrucomicrobiota bacterium]|jgi:uncharacterized protein YfcZ (UPF0381/DUF406 family)